MRSTACLALMVSVLAASAVADLEALIARYRKVQAEVSRSQRGAGERKRRVARELAAAARPVLRQIGGLGTPRAFRFLLDEMSRTPAPVGIECARAVAASNRADALRSLFRGFGRKPAKLCLVILDALVPLDDGRTRARRGEGDDVPAVDWRSISKELLDAAGDVADVEVKARLVPVLAELEALDAARGLVLVGAGDGKPGSRADDLHGAVVDELVRRGKEPAVREWLATEAFALAGKNPGRVAIVAETAGRLRIAERRRDLEKLLSHRSGRVATAAVEGLSRLESHLSGSQIDGIARRLKAKTTIVEEAAIVDCLARDGSDRALDVVLERARGRDQRARAIALGSLALARKTPRVVDALVHGLSDKAVAVRTNALRSLRGVEHKAVITALIDYLDSETIEKLRVDALKALIDLTGHNMGLVVADWKKWWEVAAARFEFPDGKAAGKTAGRTPGLAYFGIEIASKRLAFLVDASNSMLGDGGKGRRKKRPGRGGGGRRKIDLLKKELTGVLEKLTADSQVNILTFDRDVHAWREQLQPLAGGGRERAIDFVRGIETGGGTNVFDPIERVLNDGEVDTIYLLTDGRPTTGRYKEPAGIVKGVRELNRIRRVTIHCIAFGSHSQLLKSIAAENDGVYRLVDDVAPAAGGR